MAPRLAKKRDVERDCAGDGVGAPKATKRPRQEDAGAMPPLPNPFSLVGINGAAAGHAKKNLPDLLNIGRPGAQLEGFATAAKIGSGRLAAIQASHQEALQSLNRMVDAAYAEAGDAVAQQCEKITKTATSHLEAINIAFSQSTAATAQVIESAHQSI
eukprot:82381-Chlamydomonas_euryale.AAC.5